MKILAIQGSPRPEGHTQALLDVVMTEAAEAGASVETIQLAEYHDLSGCIECFACQHTPDAPGCVVEDEMQEVLRKTVEADVIVLATPVFCWSPSWYLKMAMDRFYCLWKFKEPGQVKCLIAGHKMAAVITAGGPQADGADLVQETIKRLANFAQTDWLGALIATNVQKHDDILKSDELIQQAKDFGRKLAS